MKPHPPKIAKLAENVLIGRTIYPPRCGSRRGISQQAWIATELRSEFLVIRRANEYRLISHSAKVLTSRYLHAYVGTATGLVPLVPLVSLKA